MKKSNAFAAALCCAGVLFGAFNLTGCGKKSDSGKITLMIFAQPQEKEILDQVVARFEASHPGTKVNFISSTQAEYGQKLQAQLAANALPDVFYLGPGEVRQYVDNKKVLDLSPYVTNVEGVDFNDLYENAVDTYRYDGTTLGKGSAIWALPKDFGPFAFAYNKTMLQELGIPLPSAEKPYTWKEFMDVCEKLTRDTDKDGEMDKFGTGLNPRWALIQFIWGNGADFIDETGTKVSITDPKFVEALQYWANMTVGGTQIDGKTYKPVTPSAAQSQSLDTYQRWLKGDLGFFPAGPWDLAAFNKTLEFEYDLIPWPVHTSANKTATYRGGVGYAVAANSKNPQAAAELALYLSADKEANTMYCDLDLQIPNLKSLADRYTAKGKPANRKEFLNIISTSGRAWPSDNTYTSDWFEEFFVSVQKVIDGEMTAKDYCESIQPKMQAKLDKGLAKARKSGN
ncbi:MAG: sugar ABC transporter substrate-binding protein [Treponema sp.]|nr:sugar ABC transporter substrate-binding protein [Treponema sp.]